MKQKKYIQDSYRTSIFTWLVFASSFLLMTPATELEGQIGRISVVALGLVFWISLITALVFTVKTCRLGDSFIKSFGSGYRLKRLPGLLCFFSNPLAGCADVLLIASALGVGLLSITDPENQYLYFIVIFSAVLFTVLHCFLNGNIHRILHQKTARSRKDDRKQA